TYPPESITARQSRSTIRNACNLMTISEIEEKGCAVCGQLTLTKNMSSLKAIKNLLTVLHSNGNTRQSRSSLNEKVQEIDGPVLAQNCDTVCNLCRSKLRLGEIPSLALANNLWIGEVPDVLSRLNFIEQILVSRVRHNTNFIKVNAGYRKMIAHCISWENPTAKMFN
ncbi:hypothetical protein BDZ89DRAFT_895936, partial [Hymenopellis radicata]